MSLLFFENCLVLLDMFILYNQNNLNPLYQGILKNLFGDGDYNKSIPKFDGMLGAILSISFSLFAYVYILTRASFLYQSQNLIDLGKNLGFSKFSRIRETLCGKIMGLCAYGNDMVFDEDKHKIFATSDERCYGDFPFVTFPPLEHTLDTILLQLRVLGS